MEDQICGTCDTHGKNSNARMVLGDRPGGNKPH